MLLILIFLGGCYIFADLFGLIPSSLDFSQMTSFFGPRVASAPYLEKYEGKWQFTFNDGSGSSVASSCGGTTGTVTMHDGTIFAAIGAMGQARTVRAAIKPDGTFEGELDPGTQRAGSLKGNINGTQGKGTWHDAFDCASTFTMTKIDPVLDPTVGKVGSISGTLRIVRGGQADDAFPGEELYVGDTLTVVHGSATLSLGLYPPTLVSLSTGESYEVPASFQ